MASCSVVNANGAPGGLGGTKVQSLVMHRLTTRNAVATERRLTISAGA